MNTFSSQGMLKRKSCEDKCWKVKKRARIEEEVAEFNETPVHDQMFPLGTSGGPEDTPHFLPQSAYDFIKNMCQTTSKNQTGYTGVRFNTNGMRYRATVSHKGRGRNAGTFDNRKVAAFSYDLLQLELKKRNTPLKRLNFASYWISKINKTRMEKGYGEKEEKPEYRSIRSYLEINRNHSLGMDIVYDFTGEAMVEVKHEEEDEGVTVDNEEENPQLFGDVDLSYFYRSQSSPDCVTSVPLKVLHYPSLPPNTSPPMAPQTYYHVTQNTQYRTTIFPINMAQIPLPTLTVLPPSVYYHPTIYPLILKQQQQQIETQEPSLLPISMLPSEALHL